jgi:hypothetical protein
LSPFRSSSRISPLRIARLSDSFSKARGGKISRVTGHLVSSFQGEWIISFHPASIQLSVTARAVMAGRFFVAAAVYRVGE